MSSFYDQSNSTKFLFTTQNIVLANIGWAVLALLYFLLFSAKVTNTDGTEQRADWYLIGTYIFEAVAYLGAGILCFRNWLSPQIVSGRNVWLLISFGMFAYFTGGLIFDYYEIVIKEEPLVTPADIFFVAAYIFLGWGTILAVISRRLLLEKWQWAIVAAIGVVGSLLAWLISKPHTEQEPAPEWIKSLAQILNWFYVASDVTLLIIATTLLLAFWGGRVSQSWRMIAAAAFSLYIADMWLKYASYAIPNYQSGGILEVFWVFSGVLFGIGAVLEYEASSRSRRAGAKKRAS